LDILSTYSLRCSGLAENKAYYYRFLLKKTFFSQYPESQVENAKINVKVRVLKFPSLLKINFILEGEIVLPCDRCADDLEVKIKHKAKLIAKYGDETSDLTEIDEVMTLSKAETDLPIAQHLYEYVHLALPISRRHKRKADGTTGCNPKSLEELAKYTEKKVEKSTTVDPRWGKLNDLLSKK